MFVVVFFVCIVGVMVVCMSVVGFLFSVVNICVVSGGVDLSRCSRCWVGLGVCVVSCDSIWRIVCDVWGWKVLGLRWLMVLVMWWIVVSEGGVEV